MTINEVIRMNELLGRETIIDDVKYTLKKSKAYARLARRFDRKEVRLIGGTDVVDFCAFYCCTSLEIVEIPEGVMGIDDFAFYTCSSLTSLTLPDSVTSIGVYTFGYCWSLTSIELPKSMTSIGEGAFTECSSLTSITIPEGVTRVGKSAFSGCTSLTNIKLPVKYKRNEARLRKKLEIIESARIEYY